MCVNSCVVVDGSCMPIHAYYVSVPTQQKLLSSVKCACTDFLLPNCYSKPCLQEVRNALQKVADLLLTAKQTPSNPSAQVDTIRFAARTLAEGITKVKRCCKIRAEEKAMLVETFRQEVLKCRKAPSLPLS
jgi:hypothetical protein